jgi:uncharacterized protein (TIGR02646 family)
MDIGFEQIVPTPAYPPGTDLAGLVHYSWESKAGVVTAFKKGIKDALRASQKARCCFCRRPLAADDYGAHLEHFIEKAEHPQFTFEVQNISLSCGTCNSQKNGNNLRRIARLKKRFGKGHIPRCSTLASDVVPGNPLPAGTLSYRWVHPHFDTYSLNIKIEKSWVFVGRTRKGIRTVKALNMNALARIEQRALDERFELRGGRLALLAAAILELEYHRAGEVAAAVAKVIRRRRGGG